VDTSCQSCGAIIDIPYFLLGAAITCDKCKAHTIPKALPGSRPADTGYEITFADFHRLLLYPGHRPSIARLIREWFGHEVEAHGDSVRILARDGNDVDPLALHRQIQGDESRQSALYREAMTLWH
jgi:hypothetical protein